MNTRTSGSSPTAATWQYISGAEGFNSRLDQKLLGVLDARAGGKHMPEALPATPAALLSNGMSITHELILAAGGVVGVRLMQTTMAGGAITGHTDEITYEDLGTGVVSASSTLVNPAEIGTVRDLLREVPLTPSSPSQGPATPSSSRSTGATGEPYAAGPGPVADEELLSAVAFTADGGLSITFNRDPDTGATLDQAITVALTAQSTDRVVSSSGQALREAVIAKTAFAAPAPIPGGLEHINCDLVACAALTYDDGPNAQTTRLLGILDKHKVFATFFQQGGYVNSNPAIAKAVADAGHTVANHTMSHPYLTKLPAAGVAKEIGGAQAAIEKATGVIPAYLRPPYGATNRTVAATVGLPQIIWDVDSLDWQSRNKAVFIPKIMNLVKPGSIILQHDVHSTTVDGQDELITQLKGKGFYLVTLPQLFAGIDLQPGASYKCRGTAPGCVPGR
ncbi:polysaccharide deacetylase family protein [Paenarthrobacter nicotinovorans]|uniref:polysaccharide deacetylase family protein n=1 Tax=Paenarthrobacter nicotinovorans TaxID=29320 RepID=UPI0024855D40|nr:polysaccharide deacetylase family protein [Paenarthrobacter nicotinovorans]